MQTYGLTVDKFLDHAAQWFGDTQIVEADAGQAVRRIGYGALRLRSNRLSGALRTLGLGFGDRIGTLAWNTQAHLETYYAAMGIGLVCHTLNPRLTPAHLAAMINEAEDRVIVVAADLLPVLRDVLADCPEVAHVVVIDAPLPQGSPIGTHPARLWLDLSTGINPEPWPGADALTFDWARLPDDAALRQLEAVAMAYFAARGPQVLALPGTEFGLRGLATLGLPAPFRHVWPGYRTHAEALPGSVPVSFDAAIELAGQGGTIVLANPSNPDGRLLAPADVMALAAGLARSGGWLVVDEAFIDAQDGGSIVPLLDGTEPVLVMRSFGKFFGLAGVRLGFAVGPAAMIARWRATVGSWPLSAAAIAIGTAAYGDSGWIASTRAALLERAAALDRVLRSHGLEPIGASPQFRLVACDASALFDRLARVGILTRPFDYDPRWLRLGVSASRGDLARLDRALAGG